MKHASVLPAVLTGIKNENVMLFRLLYECAVMSWILVKDLASYASLSQMSILDRLKTLSKCCLTEFDGRVHSYLRYGESVEENIELEIIWNYLQRPEMQKGKRDLPVESGRFRKDPLAF